MTDNKTTPSLFAAAPADQAPAVATPVTVDPAVPVYETLVGEGKKFADSEALARGKAESDAFILQLQTEAAQLRTELAGARTADDIYKKLETKLANGLVTTPATPTPVAANDLTPEAPAVLAGLSADDVEQILARRDTKRQEDANLLKAQAALNTLYGANTQTVLRDVAAASGFSADQLDQMARSNPDGLLTVIKGALPNASPAPVVTPGSLNTQAIVNPLVADPNKPTESREDYWKELPRKDNRRFLTAAESAARDKEAREMGPAFFGR